VPELAAGAGVDSQAWSGAEKYITPLMTSGVAFMLPPPGAAPPKFIR